LGNIKFTANI